MSVLVLAICAAVALFTASALVIFLVAGDQSPAESRLQELGTPAGGFPTTPFSYRLRGLLSILASPLEPLRDWLRSNDDQLAERLTAAGFRQPEDAESYLSSKLLAPFVGVVLATFTGSDNIITFGLIFAALGFFAPDLFLIYAAARRKNKLKLTLPDAVDLLVICIEAGLGIDQATLRVAEEIQLVSPELSEELLIISREQRAGKPRIEAWRSMANRSDLDTVRQFVTMLVQTEKLGTPIARSLSQFADALRMKRLLTAEENAAKTTVKLVFPLVFFIFPAIFIVLLGPAAITLMQSLN